MPRLSTDLRFVADYRQPKTTPGTGTDQHHRLSSDSGQLTRHRSYAGHHVRVQSGPVIGGAQEFAGAQVHSGRFGERRTEVHAQRDLRRHEPERTPSAERARPLPGLSAAMQRFAAAELTPARMRYGLRQAASHSVAERGRGLVADPLPQRHRAAHLGAGDQLP